MIKPNCPICGSRHYTHEGHSFAKSINTEVDEPAADVNVHSDDFTVLMDKPKSRTVLYQQRHREKYNAYMRDYMRKYRT